MFTLAIGAIQQSHIIEIVGYILMVLEIVLVIIKLLQKFVPSDSKAAQILARIFRGVEFTKNIITKQTTKEVIKDNEQRNDLDGGVDENCRVGNDVDGANAENGRE